MFQTKFAEKIKHIVYVQQYFFPLKNVPFMRHLEKKYGRSSQATDDNTIRRMRFACWITKATDTHSEYVVLIPFPRQQW